jgi:hypothetical protein
MHDFPDYPCPICSPKEFEEYKNKPRMNPTNEWSTQEPMEWESEFDGLFFDSYDKFCYPEHEHIIKSFISSQIKQAEERVKKRIIKLIKEKGLHLGYKNDIIDLITRQ